MEARNAVKTVIVISSKIIVLALVVILIYYAGGAAFRFGISIFNESSIDRPEFAKTVTVNIPDKPSTMDVAKVLEKAGVVSDRYLFYIQASLSNYHKYFVGGSFEVDTGMLPTQIMQAITAETRESKEKK